jgi:PAS domain S-box-containing protein
MPTARAPVSEKCDGAFGRDLPGRALLPEDRLFGALMDGSPDSIYFKDTRSRFIRINKALALRLGVSDPSDAVGKTDGDFFSSEHADAALADEQAILGSGAPLVGKIEKETWSDGRERWVSTTKMPLRDEQGRIRGTFGVSRDVTAQRHADEGLRQFAYVASHDLREPLRTIGGFCTLLEQNYKGRLDEQADRWIAFVVDGVQHMQALIEDLLAYSRLDSRAKSPEPVDFNVTVDEVVRSLRSSIDSSGAEIVQEELPTLRMEPTQARQLVQNLLSNAIKYRGQEPPRVQISARKRGREWVFSVRDNGIGIKPEFHDRIFEIFKRLHGKDEYSGTGIGLAICRKIVQRHGGRIWVDSQSGRGSTFRFTVPADSGREL